MRSVVAGPSQVQVPLARPKGSLLPHTNSSSSHTCLGLNRRVIATAAKDGGSDWYSSSSSRGNSSSNNSNSSSGDSDKKARSRHYYDSTPRYKDKRSASGEAAEQTAAMTDDFADAFADALTTSLGDSSSRSSSSSGRGRASSSSSSSSSSNSRGGRGGRSRGVSTADEYIDDLEDAEDGRGWWEVPREQRSAAAAAVDPTGMDLEPWQQEQLLLAAASSKKKMQVQTVAANTGLDRTEVLSWVAAFRAKPKTEQAKLLAPLQQQIQQLKAQQQAQSNAAQAAEAARRGCEPEDTLEQQQQQQREWQEQEQLQPRSSPATQGLPFSDKNPDTGFVPYTERRGQAGSKKRLPGEVLRTLEGVYARSPWPNKEVVAGLYDLHRLPRDTVMDWFTARREMDGLPDNPRAAKQLAATARRALDAPQPLLPSEFLPLRSQPKEQQQQQAAVSVGAAADASPQQQQQQQARARVQSITAREMAALRSALPSPRKQKGEKLKQELGIKAGPDSQQVEVSGITFVVKDGRSGWRRAWKKRRSAAGVPAQQLDFNLWMLRQEQQQETQQD